jgi:hypothetical protein
VEEAAAHAQSAEEGDGVESRQAAAVMDRHGQPGKPRIRNLARRRLYRLMI